VFDDVTDIVLNVKSLVVKNFSDQTRVVRIEKNQKGPVTGADVRTDDQVEVINKNHVITSLTENVSFLLEMVVENGRGYVPATEHTPQAQEIGIIPVDAAFSPVIRVRYEVEETRVGQKTNYDKLTMEIWTNGSVSPEMALVESAKILRKHLNPFVQYNELGPLVHSEARAQGSPLNLDQSTEAKLGMSLAELELSVRATNCLESENIVTVRDLVTRSEEQLLEVRNFGETTLAEVREKLSDIGLRLGMHLPSAPAGGIAR
jgi:DNA-directed RNA polymerase subunit alpha